MLDSRFQELDRDGHQIRLLHLQPGEFHDPISATISLAYLSDQPQYEALSYVWGNQNDCLHITLDGKEREVTINLWAALRRLRGLHEERVLWVDALCINQENKTEKSHQVRLMTEIYRYSWRGLVWLGEFEEHVVLNHDMTLDAYRNSGVTMDETSARIALNFAVKLSKMAPDGHFTVDESHVPAGWVNVTQPEVTAVNKLMSLQWWERIWTVQEFILPPSVVLVLGDILCEDVLELVGSKSALDMWKHDRSYGECCEATFARLPDFPAMLLDFFDHMRSHRRHHNRKLTLTHAVNLFRARHSTDPRDKIFGLIGLTHPMTRDLVDYSLDKKRVYINCVRYDLESTKSLCSLMRLPEHKRDMDLPSWVPDLAAAFPDNMGRNTLKLEIKYLNGCDSLFSAGTKRNMELGPSREDELRLGGRRVDTIKLISQKPPPELWQRGEGSVLMPGLIPRLRADWYKILESDPSLDLSSYPGGGSYKEAFYRTCTCDTLVPKDRSVRRVTAEDGNIVEKGLTEHGYAIGSGIFPTKLFFITQGGYIGIGPEDTRVGDVLYVLFGGHVPFLLRAIPETLESRGSHTFVGYTYVHGIMDGEVLLKTDIQNEQVVIV